MDEEGYDIDSDDDDDRVQDAITAAAERDPYSRIRLERASSSSTADIIPREILTLYVDLLAPLTSVTDLPNHPTLSRPFTSTALSSLANQGCDLMHKENAALSKVRPLLAKLTGDHTWASCEMFLGSNDSEYFDDRYITRLHKRKLRDTQRHKGAAPRMNGAGAAGPMTNGGPSHSANGGEASSSSREHDRGNEDVQMADDDSTLVGQETGGPSQTTEPPILSHNGPRLFEHSAATNGDQPQAREIEHTNGDSEPQQKSKSKGKEREFRPIPEDEDLVMADVPKINGGTQSNANPQHSLDEVPSLSALLDDDLFIHPIFVAPASAHPDRDQGLPEQEAEDVRRLLQLYIQKQEEICRGTKKLYEGLLTAEDKRKTVLGWAKSEAHCGPNRDMSDGEDWYDQEEWGLTEDLKKGQDEEEEDTTQTQKKTRNRGK